MGSSITVHHPNLTPEERKYRMEQIKKATIEFHMEKARRAMEEQSWKKTT